MIEKLKKATPQELQIWMLSAFFMALGLGALLVKFLITYALWIFLIAVTIHLWMMYKIYIKNK